MQARGCASLILKPAGRLKNNRRSVASWGFNTSISWLRDSQVNGIRMLDMLKLSIRKLHDKLSDCDVEAVERLRMGKDMLGWVQ